jgi:hypothetical protein
LIAIAIAIAIPQWRRLSAASLEKQHESKTMKKKKNRRLINETRSKHDDNSHEVEVGHINAELHEPLDCSESVMALNMCMHRGCILFLETLMT